MSTKSKQTTQKLSTFTIEHILKHAGQQKSTYLSWLHCTRYCPPKVGHNKQGKGVVKRQLGRHPRIPFSSTQVAVLETQFKQTPYLSSAQVNQLSELLQLADVRIKIWFQNRRARERREQNQSILPQQQEDFSHSHSPIQSVTTHLINNIEPSTTTTPFDSGFEMEESTSTPIDYSPQRYDSLSTTSNQNYFQTDNNT